MDIHDRRGLKAEAAERLASASYDPKKLILIHSGVQVALALLLALVQYLLDRKIGDTGGLGGMGTRSVLETIQAVLTIAQMTAAVFWQLSRKNRLKFLLCRLSPALYGWVMGMRSGHGKEIQ